MKSAKLSIIGSLIALCVLTSACKHKDAGVPGSESCSDLDGKAVELAGVGKVNEAAKLLDRAISSCPADARRLTQRGVLHAALGETADAERIIRDAIKLAEDSGDPRRAELSRAELAVVRGGSPLKELPQSCRRPS